MSRLAYLLIATLCYLAFFFSFLYFVGFLAGYPDLPTHVDKGIAASVPVAVIVDIALVALFGLQHSIMARPGFKAGWTKIVPAPIERSVYCLATAAVLVVLFAFWHELPQPVWHVENAAFRTVLWTLFGLAQAWSHFRGRELPQQKFRTPAFYKLVRHPIYLGFFVALWATPEMSLGHVILSSSMTIYLVIGATFEERDLVSHFGATYVEYQSRVSMIIPGLGRK